MAVLELTLCEKGNGPIEANKDTADREIGVTVETERVISARQNVFYTCVCVCV